MRMTTPLKRPLIDGRTPKGKAAMRLLAVDTKALITALGLPPRSQRSDSEFYSKATLCLMAVDAGMTIKNFLTV